MQVAGGGEHLMVDAKGRFDLSAALASQGGQVAGAGTSLRSSVTAWKAGRASEIDHGRRRHAAAFVGPGPAAIPPPPQTRVRVTSCTDVSDEPIAQSAPASSRGRAA